MSAGCFDYFYKMNEDDFPKPQVEVEVEVEVEVGKQGIVSILSNSSSCSSDFNSNSKILLPYHNSRNSIRRTVSADMMSSQKWLQNNNGFPHSSSLKRVKSSLQLQALGEHPTSHANDNDNDNDDTHQGPAIEDIWSSIQADNKSWGCILSNPNNDSSGGSQQVAAAPYVHPLAKRTGSSLSSKSLEICTESLGSETGSDCGFSYPPSDSEEEAEEEEEEAVVHTIEVKDDEYNVQQVGLGVVGINKLYNNNRVVVGPTTSKRSMMVPPTRPSFPPPLPSLGHRDDGSNLHIRSHRKDGRLVVEAVSVPSQNCFRAQRQDGRLLLTFSAATSTDEDGDAETEEDIAENNVQVEQQDVMEDDHGKGVVNNNNNNVQMRSCTTLAMMTNKFMELTNKSTTWPRNYNTTVIKDEFQHEHALGIGIGVPIKTQSSLPPRPTKSSTAATALNAYEYYWRRSNTTTVGMLNPLADTNTSGVQNNKKTSTVGKHTKRNNNKLLYAAHSVKRGAALTPQNQLQHQQQDVSAATTAEYVVPLMLKGCKEAKKPSLLLWKPYCIATS